MTFFWLFPFKRFPFTKWFPGNVCSKSNKNTKRKMAKKIQFLIDKSCICINFSVSVRHQLNFSASGSGKLDITVSPKNAMGRTVSCRLFSLWLCFIVFNSFMFLLQLEAVKLEIPMPKSVLNCSLTASQGKYAFDPVSKGNNFFPLE